MRKNCKPELGTKWDLKGEVEATATQLLQYSQKNKQIKNKEGKAISYLWKQIKKALRGLWQKRVPSSEEGQGS